MIQKCLRNIKISKLNSLFLKGKVGCAMEDLVPGAGITVSQEIYDLAKVTRAELEAK
jgi:hypothetical protein